MYTVSELLRHKGARVETIHADASALDAARVMNEHRIGSLVVVPSGRGGPVIAGIITERDILVRIVAERRDPSSTRVAHVMTQDVCTCDPSTSIDDLRHVMRNRRIRHVPVVDNGRLVGLVSIGDLNAAQAETLVETIHYLEQYVSHG